MTAPEPCYECGSVERIGTACKPCNPEITDPNFGMTTTERTSALGGYVGEAEVNKNQPNREG